MKKLLIVTVVLLGVSCLTSCIDVNTGSRSFTYISNEGESKMQYKSNPDTNIDSKNQKQKPNNYLFGEEKK